MHMRFLSRGFKNLQWYGMTKVLFSIENRTFSLLFDQFNLWVTVWDSFDPHAEMRRKGEKGAERKFGNLSDGFCYF